MNMRTLALALLGLALPGQQAEITAVKAAKIYTVSGGVVAPGVILIRAGKILDVLPGTKTPDGARVIDASRQVVVPGLIDAFTSEGGSGEAETSISADVRAADGYDLFADRRQTLAGGVTTTYVTPGAARLLSGQGAVVKAAGRPREARVLRAAYGLRVTLGEASKNPPGLFRPPIILSSETPLPPIRRQYPATRMGEFAALRRFFQEARAPAHGNGGPANGEGQAALEALQGRTPLVVSARAADDLIKAILFAEEFGLRLVLAQADEAHEVADLIAARKIPVILNAGAGPGRRSEADPEARRSARAAAALSAAGVRVALHAPEDADMRDLLALAGTAARAGLPADEALRAVTLTPAEILGVADRVGSIEKGKDADLVFLNGEPLGGAALAQRVMIGGETVYTRRPADLESYRALLPEASGSKEILAIRGARVVTVTQGVVTNGLILIEDGKIAYAGRMRPFPPVAKVVDATGLTAFPGFVDAHSHVGLRADQNEIAARQARERAAIPPSTLGPISAVTRLDDPEFAEAAAAGVTAVLVAPEQTGPCSLVKPGPKGATVAREVAALKLTATGGAAGYRALKEQIERGKKYHEDWEAHEKALKEKKEPPPVAAPAGPAEAPDPITGSWSGALEIEFSGRKISQGITADLKLSGTEVTGTVSVESRTGRSPAPQEVKGTFSGGELRFALRVMFGETNVVLKLSGDRLEGSFEVTSQGRSIPVTLSMTRTSSAPGQAAPGGPKVLRKDDALEPFRPLLRREIPALLVARDALAIENAVRVFREDFNLEFFVLGTEDADYAAGAVAKANAGVAFGPEFLRERHGAVTNLAEALASRGVPTAFVSSAVSSARHLPLTAVHAVRYGMDPSDALRSLTLNPARLLRLEGRLGALERGRDGDVVLATGDPLALTSRVRCVIVDGKVVYEAK